MLDLGLHYPEECDPDPSFWRDDEPCPSSASNWPLM